MAATTRTSVVPSTRKGESVQSRRFLLLLCSVVAAVAVQGAVPPGSVQQVVVSGLLGASLLLSFRIARVTRPILVIAIVLAVVGVTVSVMRAATGLVGDAEARVMNALLVTLGPPAVGLGVIRNLRAHREVRVEAVMGVLSLYMMLGLLFAFVYGAIDRLGGAPFFSDGNEATVAHCVYFSFSTLTTAGFGDFTARTNLGHTLTVFEALVGQIYLVTVVSLIVSNLGRRGPPERAPGA
ncbi:MAG TPA: potassium channel family protein [Microbacterium sp.]|nr:potassium channel family protein [Microbacterium sp.]